MFATIAAKASPRVIKSTFAPCLPTRGTKVPAGPDWIHEIKHDGYRLIVQRDGERVRLFTRNGHDGSGRFPLITEAALRHRSSSFVLDGEAVLLGVDGISDFNGLHSRKHDMRSCSMPSTSSRATVRIFASFHCISAKQPRPKLSSPTADRFRSSGRRGRPDSTPHVPAVQ
jgi:ATP-dependent DNA ligase